MVSGEDARPAGPTVPGPVGAARAAWATVGVRGATAVLRRPDLWLTALRVAGRLAPSGWWARPPRLPLPDPSYLRFRLVTAYGGDGGGSIAPDDLVEYLEWARSWPERGRARG